MVQKNLLKEKKESLNYAPLSPSHSLKPFPPFCFSPFRSRRRLLLSHELQIEVTGGSVPSRGGVGGRHRTSAAAAAAAAHERPVFVRVLPLTWTPGEGGITVLGWGGDSG